MHFVIAGLINCPQFTYAVMVAQRLKENLPDFTYLKIPKKPEEWERWLIATCQKYQWYHIHSPLIWREIGLKQGKKDFIGDINKFLDLCYDYYGIPHDVLSAAHFNKSEMDWFTNRTESEFFEDVKMEAKKRREYRSRQVCITGASCQITEVIVMELLQIDLQRREDGLEIRLFDDPTKEKKLTGAANDAKYCPGPSGFGNCRVVTTLQEALNNVDLVIVLDSFARRLKESVVKWLKRNRNAMCALGKALNLYAPVHCRVIIGGPSSQPLCYNATVLASFATKLHVRNIVVVTQDLGREMLKLLSEKAAVPLKDFYCPPVWGFVGLNKFIDIRRTLQTYLYKTPIKRINSSFPCGTEEYELRTSECLISEEDTGILHTKVSEHKAESFPQLGRLPQLAKATAIIDLLKVWGLKQEDGNGEILCLGVYSDGTFNIPQGLYWSQPVVLNNGFWVPFADFPIPQSPYFDCYYLFMYSIAALYRTKVKPRIYIPPKKVLKLKEKKKFNFDEIIEKVGMPVIRTDTECVIYLKHLAKSELGIDLDKVLDYIEEETEPEILPTEEVVREQIYCECWRQELKELQKVVFDRSSTTEVEVDLSDYSSGSEWSVINMASKSSLTNLHPEVEIKKKSEKDQRNNSEYMLLLKSTKLSSTPSTVCSCGRLSTGSVCQCLGIKEVQPESFEGENISTEHFYREQNAQIFNEDLKDAIYEDSYTGEKHVSFDVSAKKDETGLQFKFYGRKDAIRDKEADLKMKSRMSKYDRRLRESVEGEEKTASEEKEISSVTSRKTEDSTDLKGARFHGSGASFGAAEEGEGLEFLGEVQKSDSGKESSAGFEGIYSDETVQSVHISQSKVEKSSESSEKDSSKPGEGPFTFEGSFKTEIMGEGNPEEFSMTSLEKDLNAVWDEESFFQETENEEEERENVKEKSLEKSQRKREGIPLCCLCRCLVPEGLPCCPCGTSTVVEVFKKESIEVLIQSEDDISYRVEYFETNLSDIRESTSKLSFEEEEEEPSSKSKSLPPESFLPFSPAPKNKFKEATRPWSMTKEYTDALKTEKEILPECAELLLKAKMDLEERDLINTEAEKSEAEETENIKYTAAENESSVPVCEETYHIKTDFSDLKLFIPCGLEDWRLTVQKKYRDWFFKGPKIKDEAYYDIAIEDVSEDEFEVDKEIEKYFEN